MDLLWMLTIVLSVIVFVGIITGIALSSISLEHEDPEE